MNYLILRISSTLKKYSEYFKYNKNDPYECVKIMEQIAFSNYLFVSESTEDYMSRKPFMWKRRFIVSMLQFFTWTMAVKSLFISCYSNRTILVMTGDLTYLFPRPKILNLILFLYIAGTATIGKSSC